MYNATSEYCMRGQYSWRKDNVSRCVESNQQSAWVEVMQWRNKQNIGTVSNQLVATVCEWAILELK